MRARHGVGLALGPLPCLARTHHRELRIACTARRLPKEGRKLELIDRLLQLKLRVSACVRAREVDWVGARVHCPPSPGPPLQALPAHSSEPRWCVLRWGLHLHGSHYCCVAVNGVGFFASCWCDVRVIGRYRRNLVVLYCGRVAERQLFTFRFFFAPIHRTLPFLLCPWQNEKDRMRLALKREMVEERENESDGTHMRAIPPPAPPSIPLLFGGRMCAVDRACCCAACEPWARARMRVCARVVTVM